MPTIVQPIREKLEKIAATTHKTHSAQINCYRPRVVTIGKLRGIFPDAQGSLPKGLRQVWANRGGLHEVVGPAGSRINEHL
jgi:hypothetical protein